MSGNSNDLQNAFNTSATSQATADDSPAFRGPYGQNGVTTRQSPPTSGEHEALIANSFSGPAEQTDEDRMDKLLMSFPRTFGPRDPYSRPSTPAPDYHRVTASPSKIDIIVRKALADTARAQEQLALEIGKRTDAQASIQAISGLLQDGMANTMSALKHWELDKNSGVQFGSYTPLPLSAQSSSVFIQDESRYVYQHHQQSGAAQFLLRTVGLVFFRDVWWSCHCVTVSLCLRLFIRFPSSLSSLGFVMFGNLPTNRSRLLDSNWSSIFSILPWPLG